MFEGHCHSGVNHNHFSYLFLTIDIDTIEIRSDEDDVSGAIKARRTYNYRVGSLIL